MIPPAHAAVALGLTSAATWGAADFSGGLASRRAHVFGVVVVSQSAGILLAVALALAFGEHVPPAASLGWGLAAGVAGSAGIAGLYRALAIGQMGIAAPVTAVLSAGIPVLVAAATKGWPGITQLAGFVLAIIGIWGVSRPAGAMGRPQGLGLAIIAGCGFGAFLVLIDQAGRTALFWPLAAAKASSFAAILGLALASRERWLPASGSLPLVMLAGILDVGGNAFFLLAAQRGRLDVAAVLSSLYPAITVLLAVLLLRERMSGVQAAGAAAVLIAIPLIAA